jgi:hypothetical protein
MILIGDPSEFMGDGSGEHKVLYLPGASVFSLFSTSQNMIGQNRQDF